MRKRWLKVSLVVAGGLAFTVVAPSLWLLLIAAAGLLFALVFGFIDATPKLQRAAFVTAFVICGLATLFFGAFFYWIDYSFGNHVEDLHLCVVMVVIGMLALGVPFLPDDWFDGETAEQRRRFGFRSLLAFAAIGFVLALVFSRVWPYTLHTVWEVVRWLWPASGVLTGPSTTVVFTAFLNGIFFGAFGGVIGTLFSIVLGSKAPIAITIVVVFAALILWRNIFPHPTPRKPTTCESFIAGIAMDFRHPELCRKIPFEAAEGEAFEGSKEVAVTSLRSKCFQTIAFSTGNDSLCSEVKAIRGLGPYNTMDESGCVDQILHGSQSWGVQGLPISDDQLAPLVRQLGYNNQTLAEANIYPQDSSAWARYIDSLRPPPPLPGIKTPIDPQQRARLDFLSRVKNLECKNE